MPQRTRPQPLPSHQAVRVPLPLPNLDTLGSGWIFAARGAHSPRQRCRLNPSPTSEPPLPESRGADPVRSSHVTTFAVTRSAGADTPPRRWHRLAILAFHSISRYVGAGSRFIRLVAWTHSILRQPEVGVASGRPDRRSAPARRRPITGRTGDGICRPGDRRGPRRRGGRHRRLPRTPGVGPARGGPPSHSGDRPDRGSVPPPFERQRPTPISTPTWPSPTWWWPTTEPGPASTAALCTATAGPPAPCTRPRSGTTWVLRVEARDRERQRGV
jgi:hypothetical protein